MSPDSTIRLLSVHEAATVLGLAPRTVRRWLQDGHLVGTKIGTVWVVAIPTDAVSQHRRTREGRCHPVSRATHTAIRQRVRQVGQQLIVVGNAIAGAQPQRGGVFLTWRRSQGLQLTFAIGRLSPTKGWAPHALGLELPFWLTERQQWQPVRRLLRRYEQLRLWCHPRLLCLPDMHAVVETEVDRLHAALETTAVHAAARRQPRPDG